MKIVQDVYKRQILGHMYLEKFFGKIKVEEGIYVEEGTDIKSNRRVFRLYLCYHSRGVQVAEGRDKIKVHPGGYLSL